MSEKSKLDNLSITSHKDWYSQVADTYTSEQRKDWYSQVADVYNKVRPRYPRELICRAVELAQLPASAIILEVGCGPGTATTTLAQLGFSLVCLEPSQKFCQLARQNCAQYPSVEIRNTTFEAWQLKTEFNAVLAATSFHWIPPEIRYQKAADVLQDSGSLILLYNMTPQPRYEVYQMLDEIYQTQAPSLAGYEASETQGEIFKGFGEAVIDSGWFKGLVSEQLVCEATYSIDDYLALLSTLSGYVRLEPQKRDSLFKGLREALERCAMSVQVSYLSGFHIAQRV